MATGQEDLDRKLAEAMQAEQYGEEPQEEYSPPPPEYKTEQLLPSQYSTPFSSQFLPPPFSVNPRFMDFPEFSPPRPHANPLEQLMYSQPANPELAYTEI